MCGFVGIVRCDPKQTVDTGILTRMNDCLKHRGPDDAGFAIFANVGIAHRRLSIIDLSIGASQPLYNEDKSVVVVFNGEIYNYIDLRNNLQQCGHIFHTKSDTEVLVHGWEEWGTDLPQHLDGMFAFALFDHSKSTLFLARDRFGKKPLYYSLQNGTFLFGSELKAFREYPGFNRELDPVAIRQYFAHDYVPTPRTIFRDCYKMPAASSMLLSTNSLHQLPSPCSYWSLSYSPKLKLSFSEALEEGKRLLGNAVKKRLMSDVPLGVLLSGGLDSSSVVSMLREYLPEGDIQTFSIGFDQDSYDESPYAQRISDHFRTRHHVKRITGEDVVCQLEPVLAQIDEPFSDTSLLPTTVLCKFARENVTVALSGDGGDELLAGYDPFLMWRFLGFPGRIIGMTRFFWRWIERSLPASDRNMSLRFRLHHFLQGFPQGIRNDNALRCALWMSSFPPEEHANLFINNAIDHQDIIHAPVPPTLNISKEHSIDQMGDWFSRFYLHDDILVKADRASMIHSLELRSPFLDTELTEFICHLPVEMKIKHSERKVILKKMMSDRLPSDILRRKKKGFGMPTANWLRGHLSEPLQELSSPDLLHKQGLFNPGYIGRLVHEHICRKADHRKQLWTFLVYQLWSQQHHLI